MIHHSVKLFWRKVLTALQEQDQPWIEITGPRTHDQPAGGRHAHRRIDRLAMMDRSQARAVAKMSENHSAICFIGFTDASQFPQEIFVGKPMKSVSPHAKVPELAR